MDLSRLILQELTAGFQETTGTDRAPARNPAVRTTLRRCRTREQGVALMTVGHAIEYLIETRLMRQQSTSSAEREAMAILRNANLCVYNEGAEVVRLSTRVRNWFHGGNRKIEPANVAG